MKHTIIRRGFCEIKSLTPTGIYYCLPILLIKLDTVEGGDEVFRNWMAEIKCRTPNYVSKKLIIYIFYFILLGSTLIVLHIFLQSLGLLSLILMCRAPRMSR